MWRRHGMAVRQPSWDLNRPRSRPLRLSGWRRLSFRTSGQETVSGREAGPTCGGTAFPTIGHAQDVHQIRMMTGLAILATAVFAVVRAIQIGARPARHLARGKPADHARAGGAEPKEPPTQPIGELPANRRTLHLRRPSATLPVTSAPRRSTSPQRATNRGMLLQRRIVTADSPESSESPAARRCGETAGGCRGRQSPPLGPRSQGLVGSGTRGTASPATCK
jgi:hypothetical protein